MISSLFGVEKHEIESDEISDLLRDIYATFSFSAILKLDFLSSRARRTKKKKKGKKRKRKGENKDEKIAYQNEAALSCRLFFCQ